MDKTYVMYTVSHEAGVPIESLKDINTRGAEMAVAYLDLEAPKH